MKRMVLFLIFAVISSFASDDPKPVPPKKERPSLVSLSAGAILVQESKAFNNDWLAIWMLDGRANTGFSTPKNVITPQVFVIALPEKTLLDEVIFDTNNIDADTRGAKDVLVEMSNVSADAGFHTIASVELKDREDGQHYKTTTQYAGRWLRLTLKNNHGSPEYIELMDFRATGKQLTHTPFPNVSGTYSTNYNDFHIRQQGSSITGCFEYKEGLVEGGGLSGRVITYTWRQNNGYGPAIFVFSPDGQQLYGLWWWSDNSGRGLWYGKLKSKEIGSCTHWTGGIREQITKDLTDKGRSRLYGINFDFNSDRIKVESKSTLDHIVAILKEKKDWNMSIEGHTDDIGTPQFNQKLSEQRAQSVKLYLVAAGIAETRLKAVGFGATKPVARNDDLGRAQNRRVELVRE